MFVTGVDPSGNFLESGSLRRLSWCMFSRPRHAAASRLKSHGHESSAPTRLTVANSIGALPLSVGATVVATSLRPLGMDLLSQPRGSVLRGFTTSELLGKPLTESLDIALIHPTRESSSDSLRGSAW
jgi:hypothetical protein